MRPILIANAHLTTIPEITAATAQESHGISAAHGFVAPAPADFTLGASSSLIDRGIHIPGINDGFRSQARANGPSWVPGTFPNYRFRWRRESTASRTRAEHEIAIRLPLGTATQSLSFFALACILFPADLPREVIRRGWMEGCWSS